jgi:nitroreductase
MVAIVVAVDTHKSSTALFDGAIAAEHLLLAAEDQGLGACWCHIEGRDEAESLIKKLTGVPDELTVICVVTVGYKDEERKQYDPSKLLYEKIHNEKY